MARGGYARRQLFELVQNAADALAAVPGGGRIEIRLTENCLYCADNGRPIDRDGVTALMFSHLSPKRGTIEIGRFGLGFKSVLGVSDSPEFFSRSGSFRFSRERARQVIGEVLPDAGSFPVLRLPEPVDGDRERGMDDLLDAFMDWATNIVRLPLVAGARRACSGRWMNSLRSSCCLWNTFTGWHCATTPAGHAGRSRFSPWTETTCWRMKAR